MLYCSFLKAVTGFLLTSVALCCGAVANPPAKPVVVTSIKPLTLIAGELAGDLIELRQLLPDGEVPHHFAPRISQQRAIGEADLLLWIGAGLETPLATAIPSAGKAVITVEKLQEINKLPGDQHFWLNPANGLAIAESLTAALSELEPRLSSQLENNLAGLRQRLENFTQETAARFGAKPVAYIAEHDAYAYFAQQFPAVELKGAVYDVSGVEIGPRELSRLYRQQKIDCVVAETPHPPKILQNLSAHFGVDLVVIDPLGASLTETRNGYLRLLESVAEGFSACGAQS